MNAAAQQTQMDKFQAAQGHGYAAEQANNLHDILTGKDAKTWAAITPRMGPDRMGKWCQSSRPVIATMPLLLCRRHLRTASVVMSMLPGR